MPTFRKSPKRIPRLLVRIDDEGVPQFWYKGLEAPTLYKWDGKILVAFSGYYEGDLPVGRPLILSDL